MEFSNTFDGIGQSSIIIVHFSFFLFFPPGVRVQRSNGIVQRVRIVAVRRVTVAGRVGQPDQPESVHLGHTAARRHQGRDIDRRASQGPGKGHDIMIFLPLVNRPH